MADVDLTIAVGAQSLEDDVVKRAGVGEGDGLRGAGLASLEEVGSLGEVGGEGGFVIG